MHEIIPCDILAPFSSKLGNSSVRKYDLKAQNMTASRSILYDLITARVFSDVASDKRDISAARVAGIEKMLFSRGFYLSQK